MSDHLKGLAITSIGVLVLTPDTLLIRLIDLDTLNLVRWRGALQCLGICLLVVLVYRRRAIAACLAIGRAGVVVAALFSASTFFFVASLEHTRVANTLVLIAAAPLFAAVFSALLLRERPPLRTWITILVALAGIGVIFGDGIGGGTLIGDVAGLACGLMLGLTFTAVRAARALNLVPAMALSGLLSAIVASGLATPVAVSSEQLLYLVLMGLVVVPVSLALITLGPRYLPAPEVSLIMLLETVLGPLWVWVALAEQPGRPAIVGGAVVVAALALHAVLGLRSDASTAPPCL